MATCVLDASAVLAMIRAEPGWDKVAAALPTAAMSTVNAAEVFAKLSDYQVPGDKLAKYRAILEAVMVPVDADIAMRSASLRQVTRPQGLSLGDRMCLALAQRLALPVLTSDKAWANVNCGVAIDLIR